MADDPETEVEEEEASPETEAEVEETEETEAETETEEDAEEAESEVEEEAEADGDEEAEPPQKQSRGSRQFGELRRENRELRERHERIERELEDLKRSRSTGPTAEEQRAEADRIAAMTPEERADYRVQQSETRLRGELQATRFQMLDTTDRSSFEAQCRADPRIAKLAPKVEARLAALRKDGMNAPRSQVLRWVLGDQALARMGEAGGRQRRTAAATRQRHEVKNPGGRSDEAPNRRKAGKTAEERLDGVTF